MRIFPQYAVKYDSVSSFSEGLAQAKLNGKWGSIDRKGQVRIPFQLDDTYGFTQGSASVEISGKTLRIDRTGKVIQDYN